MILEHVELATTIFIWLSLHLGGSWWVLRSWEAPEIFSCTTPSTSCTWWERGRWERGELRRGGGWNTVCATKVVRGLSILFYERLPQGPLAFSNPNTKRTWSKVPPTNSTLSSVWGKYSSFFDMNSLGQISFNALILSPPFPSNLPAI